MQRSQKQDLKYQKVLNYWVNLLRKIKKELYQHRDQCETILEENKHMQLWEHKDTHIKINLVEQVKMELKEQQGDHLQLVKAHFHIQWFLVNHFRRDLEDLNNKPQISWIKQVDSKELFCIHKNVKVPYWIDWVQGLQNMKLI